MLDKITHKETKQKEENFQNYLKLIGDEQKIKLWIKTLLSIQQNLPEIINSVDKIIEMNASSLSFITDIYNTEKSTFSQVEKVIDLTERKNKLLNLYLISKNLLIGLDENDKNFLKRKYIYNWTGEELAEEYNISIRTVFRRTEKLIERIYEFLKKKNWSLNFIQTQVKNETWILDRFKKIAKDNVQYQKQDEREM